MFSRRSRSLSRSGRSTPLLFPHARQTPQPHANLDLSSDLHSQELLDQAFQPLPASSIYSSSPPISHTPSSFPPSPTSTSSNEAIPTSRLEAISDDSLFAPASTLSSRKASKLSRSFHHDEDREGRHRMRRLKAEMDIAIGVSRLYKESKHDRGKGRSASFGGGTGGGKGIEEVREVFERVKVGLEEEVEGKGVRDRLALSGDRKSSVSGKSENGNEKKGTFGGLNGKEMLETGLAVDAVVGLAAGGYALWKKHEREKKMRDQGGFGTVRREFSDFLYRLVLEMETDCRGNGGPTASSAPVISTPMDRNAPRPSLPRKLQCFPASPLPCSLRCVLYSLSLLLGCHLNPHRLPFRYSSNPFDSLHNHTSSNLPLSPHALTTQDSTTRLRRLTAQTSSRSPFRRRILQKERREWKDLPLRRDWVSGWSRRRRLERVEWVSRGRDSES